MWYSYHKVSCKKEINNNNSSCIENCEKSQWGIKKTFSIITKIFALINQRQMKMITQNRKGWDKGWDKTSLSLCFCEVMSATFFSGSSEKNIEKDTWEKIDIKVADTLSTEKKQMEDGWIINRREIDDI